jgi:hypothetical protein
MSPTRTLTGTVHDTIDDVTTAAERVHKSVAEFPLSVLAEITPFKGVLDDVKHTQDETIGAAYRLVRTINDRVRRLTTG